MASYIQRLAIHTYIYRGTLDQGGRVGISYVVYLHDKISSGRHPTPASHSTPREEETGPGRGSRGISWPRISRWQLIALNVGCMFLLLFLPDSGLLCYLCSSARGYLLFNLHITVHVRLLMDKLSSSGPQPAIEVGKLVYLLVARELPRAL
jgi:hypothetical protein